MTSNTTHQIDVFALGGTITSVSKNDAPGPVEPTLSGGEALKDLVTREDLKFVFQELEPKPSSWLTIEDILDVSRMISELSPSTTSGALVLQGTDSMEETAFIIEMACKAELPIAVTGAMRSPSALGPDGNANLDAAIGYLLSTASKARVVVMNDEVHPARYVHKDHTTRLDSFSSAPFGPEGLWSEERFIPYRPALSPQSTESLTGSKERNVLLVKAALGDDLQWVQLIADDFAGIVVEAMGGGHLHRDAAHRLITLARTIPVVVTSRCHGGPALRRTYGYEGSETHLQSGGISLADIDALKARLILSLIPRELDVQAALGVFKRLEHATC